MPAFSAAQRRAPAGRGAKVALSVDHTEGVSEQLVVSALQIVDALPGARGANVMVAPLETAAESMVPVMEAQALSGGAGNPENSPITAATAWFM